MIRTIGALCVNAGWYCVHVSLFPPADFPQGLSQSVLLDLRMTNFVLRVVRAF